jgi:thiamine-monophosphate kinase
MATHTSISEIGEIALIERIREIVNAPIDDATLKDNLLLGISDDTAVFKPTPGKVSLLTADSFIEGVHFDLTYTSMQHLGYKAMAANLSDIAAMCGAPRYAVVTLSLPAKISVEMVEEFYRGALYACKKYSCLIVGGDTTASIGNMAVTVALTGEADESKVLYRRSAKPGDLLCVTGHLGGSHAGLRVLQREKHRYESAPQKGSFAPSLEAYAPALEKHLMPKPRLDISSIFSTRITANAMIDISDGLASETHRICQASGTGAKVYEHNLPVDGITQKIAGELGEPVTDYALYGGEEYELLFTISDAEFAKLEKISDDVTIIGRIHEHNDGIELIRENGETEALSLRGFEHFPKA